MLLTRGEMRLFGNEARDYATILDRIGAPHRMAPVAGVELTVLGAGGGAANVTGGRPCGGFVMRIGGRCIVVDPGEASMTRLMATGFDPYEITDVVATHAHNDHVGQLSQAISGAIHLGYGQQRRGRIVAPPALMNYDAREATRFGFTLPAYAWRAEVVPLFWRHETARLFDGRKIRSRRRTRLAGGVTLTATEARHGAVEAMGLVFDTPFGRLGYSGDTEYFDGLAEGFAGADVLWLNLSTLGLDPGADPATGAERGPVHGHLGYVGTCKLIDAVRPHTVIVSHFGVQISDHKPEIEAALRARFAQSGIAVHCPTTGTVLRFGDGLAGPVQREDPS